jgi:plasmid replication initiation protein
MSAVPLLFKHFSFSKLNLNELLKLKTTYSQRMYELSLKFVNQGKYLMPIEDFKTFFNVPKCYKFCDINKNILIPAIKDINKNISLKVDYEKIKKRKSITHIYFTFSKIS